MLTGFRLVIGILNILGTIVILGLFIWGIIWFIKYLKGGRNEQKLVRMELGKLADEVGQIRQELKNGAEKGPLANGEGDL